MHRINVRRLIGALVIFAASGALVATALGATSRRQKSHRSSTSLLQARPVGHAAAALRFSVLSPRMAHVASTGPNGLPSGVIPAQTVGGNGFYVLERPQLSVSVAPQVGQEICVVDRHGLGGDMACSSVARAGREGIDLLTKESGGTISDAVLVPNGVKSVAFTDRDGSTRTVPVINNVAAVEDAELASVHYSVPGGVSK